jgi:uncharacterized protein (UPF0212 family)
MSISIKHPGVRIAALKSPVNNLTDKSSTLVFDTVKQIFWTQIMLKKTLLVASTAIVIATAASLPAFATVTTQCQNLVTITNPDTGDEETICKDTQSVPEPGTIAGSIALAGTLLGMKVLDAKKKNARKIAQ